MRPIRDPEGTAIKHLLDAYDFTGRKVLEIGCGDGEFTRQYEMLAGRVFGIDPASSDLQVARKKDRSLRALYLQGEGEQLPFPDQAFDIAIFAKSL